MTDMEHFIPVDGRLQWLCVEKEIATDVYMLSEFFADSRHIQIFDLKIIGQFVSALNFVFCQKRHRAQPQAQQI